MERKRPARAVASRPKKQKKAEKLGGIDMSHIPASLRQEGYTSDDKNDETSTQNFSNGAVPDYLKCPICKELFIAPEMFTCGHTVCKMCIESAAMSAYQVCPVCKHSEIRRTIPNYILSQLIESQYPELKQKRQKEVDEIVGLRKKAAQYLLSSRYFSLISIVDTWLPANRLFSYDEVAEHLKTKTAGLFKLPMKDDEIKYFLATLLHTRKVLHCGQYFIAASSVEAFVDWVTLTSKSPATNSKSKSKKAAPVVDNTKWLPFGILCLTNMHVAETTLAKLSSLCKMDIGKPISADEWRNQPSFWVKDIDLGEIKQATPYHCSCGRNHGVGESDSEDEDEVMYSDSSDDFY